jgi:hypothetical protein
MIDITCMSHSSNVAGERFEDLIEFVDKAINHWSFMMTNNRRMRRTFALLALESGARDSAVRWYAWWEVARQLRVHLKHVEHVVRDPNGGSDKTRAKMINLLDNHLNGLKLELAMIEDMGRPLVLMCYGLEGNGFLAPLTFDVWNAVLAHFDKVSDFNDAVEKAPTLAATVAAIHPNDIIAQAADFNATMQKARPVWAKLQDDNLGRLGDQMRVFRLCRLFNYDFVARHTVEALLEEFNQYAPTVPHLPNTAALRRGFTEYKARATLYATTNPLQPDLGGVKTLSITQQADSLWAFWRQCRPHWVL